MIPIIPEGEYMSYLGRQFLFAAHRDIDKKLLAETTADALYFVDTLPITPLQKCQAHFMPLPHKWLGLDIVLPLTLAQVCQLNTALTLRHSMNPNTRAFFLARKDKVPFRELTEVISKNDASVTIKK